MPGEYIFDYEKITGEKLHLPRDCFRNVLKTGAVLGFPFRIVKLNNLNGKHYDSYSDTRTNSFFWVFGDISEYNSRERNTKDGIMIKCLHENKDYLVKKISEITKPLNTKAP